MVYYREATFLLFFSPLAFMTLLATYFNPRYHPHHPQLSISLSMSTIWFIVTILRLFVLKRTVQENMARNVVQISWLVSFEGKHYSEPDCKVHFNP